MMEFDDAGNGNAVLFIHGHPFNRGMWSAQVRALAGDYRTIVPDLRGYGASPPVCEDAITLEEYAADLDALLDRLAVDKACVVGLSMGGQIAMEFVSAFPGRVSGLILAATFARAETPEGVQLRHRMAQFITDHGMALHGCDLLPKLLGRASMKNMPALAAQVYGMIAATDAQSAAAALRGRAKRRDYTPSLEHIGVPALVVVGTEDAYTTVEEAQSLRDHIPGSSLAIFRGVGHLPNLEDPERFNELLKTFLRRLYAPPR